MASAAGTILRHIHQLLVTQAIKDLSDGQLLERFIAQHEETAFAALMQRHGGLVWSVCRRVLPHEHDAEDAFQATFLVLSRKADSIRKGESVGSWLFGVAHRVAMKARLTANKRQKRESQTTRLAPEQPVSEAALHELQARLDAEVERLPVKYRAPFVLCCLEGKSRAEAAEELGWKIGTLSARLARGRQQLRQRLARRGVCLSAALTALALIESAARAAFPAGLAAATLKGALLVAAGKPLAGIVSAQAATLARGVLQTMFLSKLKIITAVLLLLGLATSGGVLVHQVLAEKQPQDQPAEKKKPPSEQPKRPRPNKNKPIRNDRYGDPMPADALDRLGTVRLRHGAAVRSVAYSGDGKLLASAGGDWLVRVWDPATGKEIRCLGSLAGPLMAVAVSHDGKLIASAGEHTTRPPLRLWSVATGKEVRPLQKQRGSPAGIAFSPDSKLLAAATREGEISLWDVKTGKEKRRLGGHQGGALAVVFGSDSKTLISSGADRTLRRWDLATGKELRVFAGHGGPVYGLALAAGGKTVASGSEDLTVRLWDVTTGRELRQLRGHNRGIRAVAFAPDGKTLLTGGQDGSFRLWQVATGQQVRQFAPFRAAVNSVAFSPDGKTVASGSEDYQVHLWNPAAGREIPQPGGHRGAVHGLAFSPDGKLLASGAHDNAICLWDMTTRKERYRVKAHDAGIEALAFAPHGRTIASVSWDGTLGLWEASTGKEQGRLQGRSGSMRCVAYSPDGKLLATGGLDGTIPLWDGVTRREIRRLAGHKGCVMSVAFSPDGKLLVSAALDKTVRVWAVETGKEIYALPGSADHNNAIALSANGRTLVSRTEDGTLHVWELATGKERARFSVKERVLQMAFAPDGKHLAIYLGNLATCVWDLSTLREVRRFTGHPVWFMTMTFSPDGRTLAGGSADSTVLLWDVGRALENKPLKAAQLSSARLAREWKALIGTDVARAYQALWTLAAAPKQAVPLVQKHLQTAAPVDAKRIERLIADLDDDAFPVRQKAMTELARLGTAAEEHLRKVLGGTPSPEVRLRVSNLLSKLSAGLPAADRWPTLRMLEVLEYIGTREARDLLKKVSADKADPWLAREAQASLDRWSRISRAAR